MAGLNRPLLILVSSGFWRHSWKMASIAANSPLTTCRISVARLNGFKPKIPHGILHGSGSLDLCKFRWRRPFTVGVKMVVLWGNLYKGLRVGAINILLYKSRNLFLGGIASSDKSNTHPHLRSRCSEYLSPGFCMGWSEPSAVLSVHSS